MKDITKLIDPYTGKPFKDRKEYQAYLNLRRFLQKPAAWKTSRRVIA
jgi:hypothetical protein